MPLPPSIDDPATYPRHLLSIPYSTLSSLNTLDIHIPAPLSPSTPQKYWIIYLHGGAWRDPLQTSTTILPTLPHLFPHPHIAALASLNYRLSPYPPHSPSDPARTARHPDHVRDVLAAIRWLQRRYRFGARYLLVGHSAGAWLGGWVCRGLDAGADASVAQGSPPAGGGGGGGGEQDDDEGEAIAKPVAWVPVCGIYSLPLLQATHRSQPVYHEFLSGAFGPDVDGAWERASLTGCGLEGWEGGRVVLLGHGRGDELVDWVQVEGMERGLRGGWEKAGEGRRVRVLEVEGRHADVWEGGREMARVIRVAVGMVVEAEGEIGADAVVAQEDGRGLG